MRYEREEKIAKYSVNKIVFSKKEFEALQEILKETLELPLDKMGIIDRIRLETTKGYGADFTVKIEEETTKNG